MKRDWQEYERTIARIQGARSPWDFGILPMIASAIWIGILTWVGTWLFSTIGLVFTAMLVVLWLPLFTQGVVGNRSRRFAKELRERPDLREVYPGLPKISDVVDAPEIPTVPDAPHIGVGVTHVYAKTYTRTFYVPPKRKRMVTSNEWR